MTVASAWVRMPTMDRDQALDALPAPYGTVIRLTDRGVTPTGVAERLGLDADAAPMLVAVAQGKLTRLLEDTYDEQVPAVDRPAPVEGSR